MINKDHWYDGIIYDKLIAPNQDEAFNFILNIIKKDSKVLDVGCGTGRMAFLFNDYCSKITGIDLSLRNIRIAKNKLLSFGSGKIEFVHRDINLYLNEISESFDYGVISYVLHEMNENERGSILINLSTKVEEIIIVDYLAPCAKRFLDVLNGIVEFSAGGEHYRNFKSFIANGGIYGIIADSGLKIVKDFPDQPRTAHIVVAKR